MFEDQTIWNGSSVAQQQGIAAQAHPRLIDDPPGLQDLSGQSVAGRVPPTHELSAEAQVDDVSEIREILDRQRAPQVENGEALAVVAFAPQRLDGLVLGPGGGDDQ